MLCELVQIRTPDLVRLDGAFYRTKVPRCERLDAALLLSGLAGNFYSSRLLNSVGRHLLELGIDVLQANTRGHDGINWISIAGRTEPRGAAFESVGDCRQDVAGWIQFLAEKNCDRIALVGHSLGAIKALYSQAHQPQSAVKCIAAMSASRLNYELFLRSSVRFRHWFELAKRKVASGEGRELLHVDFPFPAFITAEAYIDKYGPPSRYDWTTFIQKVDVPVWLAFGELELNSNVAFQGISEILDDMRTRQPVLHPEIVPGADHFYVGRRHILSQRLCQWLQSLDA